MPVAPALSSIPVGTVLADKYRVTREIGRGGMAAVYEAQNVDIGKRVAVKVLNAELTHSTVVIERFLREARAAAAVNSPYICDVYDAGKLEDGRPFLVLELLEGESLYDRMVKVRRFDTALVSRIFTQIGRGLTKAHEASIIHRDLKPENIFLTTGDDGETVAKILDFGLAKFYEPSSGTGQVQHRLTREGAIFGTPAYMSPEQVKGQGAVDHRADLWALGCMVFECLIGRTVWTTDQGVAMIFAQVATAPLPVPSRLRKDLPLSFDRWFSKALQRDPAKRFQSAKELSDELAAAFAVDSPRTLSIERQRQLAPPVRRSAPGPDLAPSPAPPPRTSAPRHPPPPPVPVSVRSNGPVAFAPTQPPPAPKVEAAAPADLTPLTPPMGIAAPVAAAPAPAPLPSPAPVEARASVAATASTVQSGPSMPAGPQSKRTPSPMLWSVGGAVVVGLLGLVTWRVLVAAPTPTPAPLSSASATASASAASAVRSAEPVPTAISSANAPKWTTVVQNAQALFAKGESDAALKAFKEAAEAGGGHTTRVLLEQVQIATASKGLCRMHAIGRPRSFDLQSNTRRPTVVATQRGALVVWADDHEVAGQWHAYSLELDSALRPAAAPIDVTPEASGVIDPRLFVADDRIVLLYGDGQGASPGVYLRVLDSTGRITAPAVRVSDSKSTVQGPSIARGPIGDYWLALADDKDKDSSDLYLQKLSPSFRPAQPMIRATDLVAKIGKTRARLPSVAVAGNNLQIVFRLEDGRDHAIMRQKIALNDPGLVTGLLEVKDPKAASKERFVGEMKAVTEKRVGGNYPGIACDNSGCMIVWREEPKGTSVAFLDTASGTILWRKKFSAAGTQVSVALDGSGKGLLAWYEAGRVKVAPITRDGLSEASIIGRVMGDQLRPEVVPAGSGEWLLAWNDMESTHIETFVGQVGCR